MNAEQRQFAIELLTILKECHATWHDTNRTIDAALFVLRKKQEQEDEERGRLMQAVYGDGPGAGGI